MTSKDRMLKALAGETVSPPPAALHSWGVYKLEFAGFNPKFQCCQGGEELAVAERAFHERFKPDWIHCGSGAGRQWRDRQRRVDGDRAFLRSDDGQRWIEIQENYQLAPDPDAPGDSPAGPRLTLESQAAIDEYFDAGRTTVDDLLASGTFDHMKRLADAFGDQVLIAINDGLNYIPCLSYEDALVEALEKPGLVAHVIRRQCENFMPRVLAAKACGAQAYILSEGFGGSLGQISPELEERVQADAKRWFYAEIRKAGLLPIGYWLGDVRPHLGWLNRLNMAGLMIEEDKKGFTLDPLEIRRRLQPETCLFGNLDSALLLRGAPDSVRAEVRRQRRAAEAGAFIFANGSPIVLGTPAENLDAFLQEARRA
jgi:uroporphyrinogen-III decarboxylase